MYRFCFVTFKNVDCLMYADYILMFSSSPEGLQPKLNSLEKYCDELGMQVNSNKTKVIIFNKAAPGEQ